MLSFFRRILNSRIGIVVAGLLLAVIAVGFAMTDVGNSLSGAGAQGGRGEVVAKIGKEAIYAKDVRDAMERGLDAARRENPTLDMAGFIKFGGFDLTLNKLINDRALDLFGREQGMVASKKLVDGEIASMPGLQNAVGKFDQQAFLRALSERNMTEGQFRDILAGDILRRQLMLPVVTGVQTPRELALPYASLQLETRDGTLAAIPSEAMERGADPTEAELADFYKKNIRRYTVPERRIIRYAPFGPERFAALKPTDAEIAKAYNDRKAEFAAKETRSFTTLVLPTRETAQALAAKVRAGTAMDEAARAAGFEALNSGAVEKAAFAAASSPAIANAGFAAANGAVLDPIQSALGWTVVKVDAITAVPARTLDQVREELAKGIERAKIDAAIADLHGKIQDAVDNGSTFDEIVTANKLAVVTTPAVMANGGDPDKPDAVPPPELAQVLRPAFEADADDDPSVIAIGPPAAQTFALMRLKEIKPPTPKPLAEIKQMVANDFLLDRRYNAANAAAKAVIQKVGKGMALDQALREVGRPLPPTQAIGGLRKAITQGRQEIAPTDQMLFSMAAKSTKLLPMPNKQGWFLVHLKTIVPGDAKGDDPLVNATRTAFEGALGNEYVEAFAATVRVAIGVTRDEKAIAKLKSELIGEPAQ